VTQYSVLECLDRVEQVLESGTRIPFTNRRAVDVLEILDLIDRVRIALPDEFRDARGGRAVPANSAAAQAGETGRRAPHGARERSAKSIELEERSAELLAQAQAEAEQIRAGAREYAESTLKSLNDTLERTSAVVQRGIEELKRRGKTQG
jgi:flagellar biosynthesis/type III secretory pathway protein FliH